MKKEIKETSLLERSKYTLDVVNSWINSADSKVGTSCEILTIMCTALSIFSFNIYEKYMTENLQTVSSNCVIVMLMIGAVGFFMGSMFFHFWAIYPNLFGKTDDKVINEFSIFYEEIRKHISPESYIKIAKESTEDEFIDEVLREVFYNSEICSKKMKRFKIGIGLATISVIMFIAVSVVLISA